MKEDEVGRVCSTSGKENKIVHSFGKNSKERVIKKIQR
jgi:hypothetical protein